MAILGIPVIMLIAVGLLTIMLMKFLVFVVLPIMAAVWLVRRLLRKEQRQPTA
jgi:antibiotic biosynthesis monooxygenase (ABM) superfamily enzyme